MIETTKKIRTYRLQELKMRDPFIFADSSDQTYYLFGTTGVCNGAADIDPYFEVWRSKDLISFEGPYAAFQPEKNFWGVKDYWAPEVHRYGQQFYMFASFKGGPKENRGTGILIADHPAGPYRDHSRKAVTLVGEECLDGTLYLDENQKPWIVFCQEWTSRYYGKIKALPLTDDLSAPLTQQAVTLVDTETDNLPWIRHMSDPRVEKIGYLTDAPFLHKMPGGSLLLLWSSYSIDHWNESGQGGYVVAQCHSATGSIEGPWTHLPTMLLDEDAGHAALFYDFAGELRLICHCNDTKHGREYPVIYRVIQNGATLTIACNA